MASAHNRGTKSKPRYVAKVKLLSGEWKVYSTHANSQGEADRLANEMQQRADKGLPPVMREESTAGGGAKLCGALIDSWLEQLDNRNAPDDRYTTKNHVRPHFAERALATVNMHAVVAYLDELKRRKGSARLSSASQRKCFNLLSRFLSWCVERGHCEVNACRLLPPKSKARPSGRAEKPRTTVIEDDDVARRVFHELRAPFHLVFLLGYFGGLRPGEGCGLRPSDLDYLGEGIVRVRYNRLGPLKEDKGNGPPKVKWAPVSDDLAALLKAWRARREDQGAEQEDLLFPQSTISRVERRMRDSAKPKPINSCQLSREWLRVKLALKLPAALDQYSATRHTFATRNFKGERPELVQGALGHADERMTRHYAHVIRKLYPETMRRGLGLAGAAGLSSVK